MHQSGIKENQKERLFSSGNKKKQSVFSETGDLVKVRPRSIRNILVPPKSRGKEATTPLKPNAPNNDTDSKLAERASHNELWGTCVMVIMLLAR